MKGYQIKKIVNKYYGVDLNSNCRSLKYMRPRQVAQYLCRLYTNLSYQQIAYLYGNTDHTTILNNIRKVESLWLKDIGVTRDLLIFETIFEGLGVKK